MFDVPILHEKEFVGVIGLPFNSEFIIQLASKATNSIKKGYSFIIDDAGLILFHPKKDFIIQKMMVLMQQVTQHASEMILQIGLDRKIVHANEAFEKITGKKVEEAIGHEPALDNPGDVPADVIWQSLTPSLR